jgi:hypothetical protein
MPHNRQVTSIRRPPDLRALENVAEIWEHRDKETEPSDVQTSGPPNARQEQAIPGTVKRKGRLRADGSRVGAREMRRKTVYLPPELDDWVVEYCRKRRIQISDFVADAVQHFKKQLDV